MKKPFTTNEIRKSFLDFFESKEHLVHASYSLVPENDNSLLLINAGMAPLKPYFTGQVKPPKTRMATCQKCIRTGDIENVGKTSRHATFFEMLGNFSFGDYFKKEAIAWSWEYLTKVIGLDENRLYPSVYEEDDEAFDIWNKDMNIPKERIYRFGKEDNFWEHGAGPCGPCSEIYYDRGEKYGCGKKDCQVGCDCDRYVEIWNNVFTQFEGDGNGNYTTLKNKNIDTGMGLERLVVAVQDVESIFDIDSIKALVDAVSKISGIKYEGGSSKSDVSIRVITDHIRAITFMASDGIFPSNEGRGYVFRRLLRRACRHGRLLGINGRFLNSLTDVVIDISKDAYPELLEKQEFIHKIIETEEEQFNKTLDQGLVILSEYLKEMKNNNTKVLSGESAFKLYDTYGFPLDLTIEILEEQGFEVDTKEFDKNMENQKQTARNARGKTNYMGADTQSYELLPRTLQCEFVGYDNNNIEAKVIGLVKLDDKEELVDSALLDGNYILMTDKTCLYATSGGQEKDNGVIKADNFEFEIMDVKKVLDGKIIHIGKVTKGEIKTGDNVTISYDEVTRNLSCANHSATHLLQQALRDVLGSHVEQAGSYVDSNILRFDFSHFSAMTGEEISKAEKIVNDMIDKDLKVETKVMSIDDAKKTGANALFGEKYGDTVRVVFMGEYSKELCGGTHVKSTGEIKCFKIISEGSVASGIRRIEAKTSRGLIALYEQNTKTLTQIEAELKTTTDGIIDKIRKIENDNSALKQSIENLKKEMLTKGSVDKKQNIININGVECYIDIIDDADMKLLASLGDDFKNKNEEAVVVLAGKTGESLQLMASANKKAVDKGVNCNDIIKCACEIVGGSGGGKPNMARGGGKDITKIDEMLDAIKEAIKKQLGE